MSRLDYEYCSKQVLTSERSIQLLTRNIFKEKLKNYLRSLL